MMQERRMKQVEVYTDGACSGNPGPGGWGAVLRYRFNGKVYEKELSGGDASTTNNRMELTAFIEALRQLKEPCEVRLCSDSQYVINDAVVSAGIEFIGHDIGTNGKTFARDRSEKSIWSNVLCLIFTNNLGEPDFDCYWRLSGFDYILWNGVII